jgi:hypothetical protein
MERLRSPLQGIWNIVRFNRHLYLLAGASVMLLVLSADYMPERYSSVATVGAGALSAAILLSLIISLYVYDLSGFYALRWLDGIPVAQQGIVANIHAGFDETSMLLRQKYPDTDLRVFDFYDPDKHTERSIKRARAVSDHSPGMSITTRNIPLADHSAQTIFMIFAAHEIRNDDERTQFFLELNRSLKNSGKVIVTEHIRDFRNVLAYNIGAFHFLPRSVWSRTFSDAGFFIASERRHTPFVTTFILEKRGAES